MRKSVSGFTIVELLIVIVVIAILAAISIVAYQGIQDRARASAVASDLKSTEKALRLHFTARGYSTWPRENYNGLPANPSIQYFIDNEEGFSNYMSTTPTSDDGTWEYDSDGSDKNTPCGDSSNINQGINIAIKVADERTRVAIDKIIDNGDGNLCGKYRWFDSGTKLGNAYLSLSYQGSGPL